MCMYEPNVCVFCFVFQLGVKFRQCLFRLHVYHISIYIPSNAISFPKKFGSQSLSSLTVSLRCLPSWFAVLIFFSFCFLHFMADFNFFSDLLLLLFFAQFVRLFRSMWVFVCVHSIQTSFRFQQLHSTVCFGIYPPRASWALFFDQHK